MEKKIIDLNAYNKELETLFEILKFIEKKAMIESPIIQFV
jgi:hypothetical protein